MENNNWNVIKTMCQCQTVTDYYFYCNQTSQVTLDVTKAKGNLIVAKLLSEFFITVLFTLFSCIMFYKQ